MIGTKHIPSGLSLFSVALVMLTTTHILPAQTNNSKQPRKMRVGILIYNDVEPLDFVGPYEVFSASSDKRRQRLFDVVLVAESEKAIRTRGGMKVIPDHTFVNCPKLDIVVVPGTDNLRVLANKALLKWTEKAATEAELTTSVCTGSFILAKIGLLDGKRATSHWRAVGSLGKTYPKVRVIQDKRVVRDGKFVTSAGVSAGIDMALKVVADLHGMSVSRATARFMEYPYPEDDARK